MRFRSWLLLGALAIGLVGVNEARAAPTFQAAGTAVNGTGAVTPAWPTHQIDDIALLVVESTGAEAVTLSTAAGFVEVTNSPQTSGTGTGDTRLTVFWARATSAAMASPTVADPGNHVHAQIITYRNVYNSGNPWDVTGGGVKSGTASTSLTVTGVTTTVDDTLVVQMVTRSNDANGAGFSAQANANLTGLTERADDGTNSGEGGGFAVWDGVKATAGATGSTTATVSSSLNAFLTMALKPAITTTLGNGTDPANASLAPSGAATMADAFTFQTSSGTDTITDVTVGLGTGASAGLGLVEITDDTGTTVYGSVTDPASDTPTVTLSTNTLTATTTQTQYKIRVTPKSHTAMPAPPGATYSVTAKINSWTGTNTKLGSDTAGTTITIDNLSPGNVTAASGTAGDTQVALTWTNPADADLNSIIVLRDTAAVVDSPVEGTIYTVGNTIGTSVVRCVVTPPTASCTDTSVTNGISYHYKIFTKDNNGNYATGVVPTGSPFQPAAPGCYVKATGNWESATTWAAAADGTGTCPGAGGVPDATTPAYINVTTAYTVTVTTATAAAASVLIGAPGSGTTTLAIGSGTLTVGGSVTVAGGTGTKKASLTFTTGTLKVGDTITDSGATVLTWGTGTVEYNGTGTQTVANYGYYNLTINKSAGTASPGANITIGNNLTVSSGTLDIVTYTADGSAVGTVSVANGATLRIGGGGDFPANYATPPSLGATSTVEYYGNIYQPVTTLTYGHLALSGTGRKAPGAGTITIAGNFSIASGTECDADVSDPTLKIAGNFTNNGTFTAGLSTVELNGTAAQSISGVATTLNNLTISNAAGVNAGSTSIGLTGNFSNNGMFNADTSTVTFNGTAAQTIGGATAPVFYNLSLNNTAGLSLNVNTTVSNTLTFSNGLINTGTNTLIMSSETSCGVSGAGSGKYVVGKLRKRFNTTTQTTCNFEVGDSYATTHYTPLNVSFASVSTGGYLTVKVSGGSGANATADDHPQVIDGSAALDSANSINRFWMLVPAGGLTFSNATLTFSHLDDATWLDHDNSTANVGHYVVKQLTLSNAICYTDDVGYSGAGSWSIATGTGTQTATQTAVTGVSSFGTNCSHFAIGRSTISGFLREREFIFQREVNY